VKTTNTYKIKSNETKTRLTKTWSLFTTYDQEMDQNHSAAPAVSISVIDRQ